MKINVRKKEAVGKNHAAELKKLGLNAKQIESVVAKKPANTHADIPGKITKSEKENLRKRLMFLGLSNRVDEFI